MFGPRGYQVFQVEQTGLIQTFVESALERAVAPTCSLNFLYQNSKPLSMLVSDYVFDRYSDRPVVGLGNHGQTVEVIERCFFDAGFNGEVD
jgi:hypothetical protein